MLFYRAVSCGSSSIVIAREGSLRVCCVGRMLPDLTEIVSFSLPSQDAATPTLKSVVALLKLGDWDPDVFYKFRDTILNQVSYSNFRLGFSRSADDQ